MEGFNYVPHVYVVDHFILSEMTPQRRLERATLSIGLCILDIADQVMIIRDRVASVMRS